MLANNDEQSEIFAEIANAIDNNLGAQFVLNAPGGCGKTFLFNCVSTYIGAKDKLPSAVLALVLQHGILKVEEQLIPPLRFPSMLTLIPPVT